jgi:Tol biopolymer transport system component
MAIAALVALLRPSPIPDRAADVMSILPPGDTTLTEGESPQVSPNGQTIAFVATDVSGRTRLYVRDRSAPAARALEETDDASQPFWSPDSRSIGFFAASRLKRVSLAGGRPQTLARAPVPRGGTWNRDDVIVFVPSPEQSPRRIAAAGGDATALPVQPGVPRWLPVFLPDGRHYLYIQGQRGNVSIGSIETPDATDLMPSHTNVTFLEPGYLMFRRDESLFVQRFNAASRRLEGAAVVLADKVSFNPITRQMMASASNDGFLTYVGAGRQWHLTWFDREGRRLTNAGTIGGYNSLCLTADGKRVIYDVADPVSGNVDLWSLDLADGRTTHLTFHPFPEFYVVCSPTTDEIIFSAARKGTPNLYRLLLSSPGAETLLRESSRPELTTQWSRDGKFLLFSVFSPETDFDIWMQPLTGDAPVALIATEATETGGQLAPNGRWIAYSAGQAGNHEVYVQPLPSNGTRWQVSRGGGRQPQWRPDGRQLYYISLDKKLIAVDVDTSGPQFVNGASRVLVDTRVGGWERTHLGNPYGISANGERVLVANAGEETLPISVLVNWQSMMRP